MIEQQIRPWDVHDSRVLQLYSELSREMFVPPAYQALAFSDIEVPLAHEQHMMTPKVEARMLQALAIQSNEYVLEIGTGSGFITACMARLGDRVHSIDYYADLVADARLKLQDLNISNAILDHRDLYDVIDQPGVFNVIAVTASLPAVDERILAKLSVGGRAFLVVGEEPAMVAKLITCTRKGEYRHQNLFETRLTRMIGSPESVEFEF